jgi:hypothetical protein
VYTRAFKTAASIPSSPHIENKSRDAESCPKLSNLILAELHCSGTYGNQAKDVLVKLSLGLHPRVGEQGSEGSTHAMADQNYPLACRHIPVIFNDRLEQLD